MAGKLSQLFYSGPSIETLGEEYARKERIDDQAPVQGAYQVQINAPVAEVWRLLSDAENWHTWYPDIHDVRLDSGVVPNGTFTWKNGKAKLRSTFIIVEPEREITWTGVSSGSKAVHRHVLEPTADGGTQVYSEESMAGLLLVLFYNSTKLQTGMEAWLNALKSAAEKG